MSLGQNPTIAAEVGEGRPADRLSAVVAIVIAFTTLVAAVAGFLQADTAQAAGNRRDEAEQLALQALSSAQSSRENAQVELETFHLWVEQRTQAGNALLASLYSSSDPVRQNTLLLEQQRWETIAAATLKQSELDPNVRIRAGERPDLPAALLCRGHGREPAPQRPAGRGKRGSVQAGRARCGVHGGAGDACRGAVPLRPDAGRYRQVAPPGVLRGRAGDARCRAAVDRPGGAPAALRDAGRGRGRVRLWARGRGHRRRRGRLPSS